MIKKYLWSLLVIMVAAMLSVSFSSCGGDDDDDEAKVSIVGTWKWEGSGKSRILTFQSNGSGIWKEDNYGHVKSYSFSYTFNNNDMTLRMVFPDGDVETMKVEALTATSVVIDREKYIRI